MKNVANLSRSEREELFLHCESYHRIQTGRDN